ncbi:MAG: trypsin-like peptidase domain-containing protein [Bacteroidetes bacterium]|nr:trypsin-like peptidase domain-containing protein [Bacteroidota bacterium]
MSFPSTLVFQGATVLLATVGVYHLVAGDDRSPDSSPANWVHPTHASTTATPNWPSPAPANLPSGETPFVRAAEASVHAVVHVQTTSVVPDYSNPWLSMLGMASGRVAQGSGSGVVVDSEGLIVTNHHVIEGARQVRINLSDGSSYDAKVLGSDPSTDLAILQVDADRELEALTFGNSDEVRVGEWVLAVGNPLNLTSTVTAGIISAKGRNIRLLAPDASRDVYPVESFLQTDAAVNPGNSGGALVNLDGKLVGINTAIASQTGSYAGYSFAIPSSIVAKVVRDLKEFGRVQRAYLGVQVDPQGTGVRIGSTSPGGGAEAAGLQSGDRILKVEDVAINSFPALQEQLSKHRPGDEVAVTLDRNGQRRDVKVTLTDRHGDTDLEPHTATPTPAATSRPKTEAGTETSTTWQEEWGVRLRELSPSDRQTLRLRGGVVAEALRDGEWKRQGLDRGFILLRVDGTPVHTEEEVRQAVERAAHSGEQGVLLEGIYPNGQRAYAGVAVPKALAQPHK